MIILYGIKHCDTIKKARNWLEQQAIEYRFHDYKVNGLTPELLTQLIQHLGYENLVNKRGTTYRALPEEIKQNLTLATAGAAMLANPSLIKRPVLEYNGQFLLGFDVNAYQTALQVMSTQ